MNRAFTSVALAAALLSGGVAHAQAAPDSTSVPSASGEPALSTPGQDPAAKGKDAFYIPYGNLHAADPAEVKRAQQLGTDLARDLLQAYEQRTDDPELAQAVATAKRRVDDIADPAMAAEHDKVLEFLGIDPKSNSNLYYFVSWSMPLEMLRSYAIEAMWSGGTLVFKGVPPGRSFGDFLSKDLLQLTYGKAASANISLDPRLFDAYQVTTVPTIALTTVRADIQCIGVAPVTFQYKKQDLQYSSCPPLDPSAYSKMSGAVTSQYALETFRDDGMKDASTYLRALARGLATGETSDKAQKPFAGQWENVVSPSERMATEAAIQEAKSKQEAAAAAASASQAAGTAR